MKTSGEAIARMEALVHDMAKRFPLTGMLSDRYADEAREIVKLLPEPVDPDLRHAREAMKTVYTTRAALQEIDEGQWDNTNIARIALFAIKAARAG